MIFVQKFIIYSIKNLLLFFKLMKINNTIIIYLLLLIHLINLNIIYNI